MVNYRRAEEVRAVAREIIAEHRPELTNVRIEYVFMDKVPNSKGKALWGRAKKKSGLDATLASGIPMHYGQARDFFVIEIAERVWLAIPDEQKRALVDHELAHCFVDYDEEGENVLSIMPHDVEEFNEIIARHGAWRPDVEKLERTFKQIKLPGIDKAEEPEEAFDAEDL